MKKTISATFLVVMLFSASVAFYPIDALAKGAKKKGTDEKLLKRIDFGNSYIMGQTIKSGAVYLLQRKSSEIKSMLDYRKDYRQEILEDFTLSEGSNK